MKISEMSRNHLRYVLYRFKAQAEAEILTEKAESKDEKAVAKTALKRSTLTVTEFHKIATNWGHKVNKKQAGALLSGIRTHFEKHKHFSAWELFASEIQREGVATGSSGSWDVGMVDGDGSDESRRTNIARMVNRPHKWFLFDAYYTEVVPTRGFPNAVTNGLDHFEKHSLVKTTGVFLRERQIYPDRSGKSREFDYHKIYEKGLNHGANH